MNRRGRQDAALAELPALFSPDAADQLYASAKAGCADWHRD